jgi:radical SAM superfamily enzyme YgiQ (UPF0313 family)
MTYWYPGVQEAINLCRETLSQTPILLGGIYARLCESHALTCGADRVVTGMTLETMASVVDLLKEWGIESSKGNQTMASIPYPAFDLLHGIDYVALLTSSGCPYKCHYCASSFLNPGFFRRDIKEIIEEILYWNKVHGVHDFAFYDDALLLGFETHAGLLCEKLAGLKLDLRFHTPNALHVKEVTADVAEMLRLAGFRTIRLGFETSDMALHECLDKKVAEGDFEKAVSNLRRNGFDKKEIGAYILAGLPDQSIDSVMESIEFVANAGATAYLAQYSPLPHTPLWRRAVVNSTYDIVSEPLFHNNTLLPCWKPNQRARFAELKNRVRALRMA